MSAETALRALLIASAPVTTLVGQRIASDRIEQGATRPFIVYTRTASDPLIAIDGTVYATNVAIDLQCWADTRLEAEAVADAVTAAIRATSPQLVSGRSGGYDADLDLEVASLSIEWWE